MVILGTKEWARVTLEECKLGDQRRTKRLIKWAEQAAAPPDGSTPDQTESWADCKAAYRLFDQDDVKFDEIIRPHCEQTRASCRPGDVKLLINDTTEVDFGRFRRAAGLGPTGKGTGRGFFLHSALMLDAADGRVEGMAGQILFSRKPKSKRRASKNSRRRAADRESVVWGQLVDRVGPAPAGVKWVHVDDRGADDVEVFCRIQAQGNSCVIRAARLKRWLLTPNGERVRLASLLETLPLHETTTLKVPAKDKQPARTATLELRFAEVRMPMPSVLTPWLRKHRPAEPLRLWVVELREPHPPTGVEPLHWGLYTREPVTDVAAADTVIEWYQRRPTIEVASAQWVRLVQIVRRKPENPRMTIREFLRAVAGLGGHLGRKCDGEPGWITLWRGLEKLILIARGADAQRKKCG